MDWCNTHMHVHTLYSMCVCQCFCLSNATNACPYVILDESWHHADFFLFFFFLCKRLVVMATRRLLSMQVYPSILGLVCVHVQNKRRQQENNKWRGKNKTWMEDDEDESQSKGIKKKSQQIKITAGSLLSACHDGLLWKGRALKINLKQALTHIVICIMCVCVLKFYPEVLPQIPLKLLLSFSPKYREAPVPTAKTVGMETDQ